MVVLVLSILPGIYLGKLGTWHPLLVPVGFAAFGIGIGISVLYPSRRGYRDTFDAFFTGRGSGLWWWGWAYGAVCLMGLGLGLAMEGGYTP